MLPNLPPLESITIGGFSVDVGFYLTQDYQDIGHAAAELPAIIEYLNVQYQIVTEQRTGLKQEVKRIEAESYFRLKRGEFRALYGEEKMTESALEKAIALDGEVVKAYQDYAVLDGWVNRLRNTILILQMKLEMTRSSEATRRALVTAEQDAAY